MRDATIKVKIMIWPRYLPWNILARLVEIFAFNNEHVSRWDLCVDYRFPKKEGQG
jgi:hypothetical protein